MKQGTTPTLEFKLDIEISNVTKVYFTFTDELKYKGTSEDDTPSYLLQKNYPDDATFEDDTFKLPLTQEETDLLTNTFYVEAQVICDKAVVKSDIKKVNMPHTLWTTYVDDNESDGQSEVIHLSFSDNVIVEGGGSSNYNDLSNKPRINNTELIGNKTDTDLGLATKTELNAKQNVITGGNGIDVTSDVVSVDLKEQQNYMVFTDGKLGLDLNSLGSLPTLRQSLANTSYLYALASKTYVDNLMSGAVKRLVVESLPTQDIDTNTIYMVLKSAPTTNNIYDEYMYINNAWELIGTTEVDLSNHYTKSQTDTFLSTKVDKVETQATIEVPSNTQASSEIDVTNYAIFKFVDAQSASVSRYVRAELRNGQTIIGYKNIYDSTSQEFVDIDLSNATSIKLQNTESAPAFPLTYQLTNEVVRERELTNKLTDKQDKLTAGTNITIVDNVISASGGGLSYTFTDGLSESSGTVGIDIASGSELEIDSNHKLDIDLSSYATTTDLSSKQDTIDTTHKLSADLVDDTSATNKFVTSSDITAWNGKQDEIDSSHKLSSDLVDDTNNTNLFVTSSEKSTWNGKADNTVITTDTSSTTVSLTLADNHEYRYTQDLTSLTLTMPSGDFIASIVFASGSTPTSMTYDSSIKWSGDDVTNGQFVPTEKTYNIVMWYDGINVNGVVRGV